MTMIVTLAQARDHLRSDTTADDNDLRLKIEGASGAVLNYLKKTGLLWEPERDSSGDVVYDSQGNQIDYLDSTGERVYRREIQNAVLILLGEFYTNRAGEQQGAVDSQFGYGYLPRPVVALLYPLRDPALA